MKLRMVNWTWDVDLVDSHDPSLYVDGEVCIGACWPVARRISISKELAAEQMKNTITHELTHAIMYETQIDKPESYDEEALCGLVALWGRLIVNMADDVFAEVTKNAER